GGGGGGGGGGQEGGREEGAGQGGALLIADPPAGRGAAGHRLRAERGAAGLRGSPAGGNGLGPARLTPAPAWRALGGVLARLPGSPPGLVFRGGSLAGFRVVRACSVPRSGVSACHDPLTRVARRSRTCAAAGFVRAVPLGNTTVGPV